ncbi:MAG: threonylcarbamoyl-AMP synthase [SAR324 cluster bacterium]|nr:threonylcarbamoyl-AMP synthase [SAR324 cluster bacterium]
MLLVINPQNPQQRLIDQAVSVLQNDGVIIYPTDTVYGLGCSVYSKKAMEQVCRIKEVDRKKPLTFVCSSERQIQEYTQGIDAPLYKLIRRQFPGPYTFILEASKIVPKIMLTKRRTIGVRYPDHPITLALVESLGHPMISTSLRADEEDLHDDPHDLHEQYKNVVDMVIDGGVIFAENSTIVDFTSFPPEVIRQGKGDLSWLENALK